MSWLSCWMGIVFVAVVSAVFSSAAVESGELSRVRFTLIWQGQPGAQGTLTGRIGGEPVGVIQPCILPAQVVSSAVLALANPEPHLTSWDLILAVIDSDGRTNSCTFTGIGLPALLICPSIGNPNERLLLVLTPAPVGPPESE
jgi:hypothetical protein